MEHNHHKTSTIVVVSNVGETENENKGHAAVLLGLNDLAFNIRKIPYYAQNILFE